MYDFIKFNNIKYEFGFHQIIKKNNERAKNSTTSIKPIFASYWLPTALALKAFVFGFNGQEVAKSKININERRARDIDYHFGSLTRSREIIGSLLDAGRL